MSSTYGEMIRLSIFGQSHGAAIGMTLDGVPAGRHRGYLQRPPHRHVRRHRRHGLHRARDHSGRGMCGKILSQILGGIRPVRRKL